MDYLDKWMIIRFTSHKSIQPFFSKSSTLVSTFSSIYPFLQIILALNLLCGIQKKKIRPPTSSDDLCLYSCEILLL